MASTKASAAKKASARCGVTNPESGRRPPQNPVWLWRRGTRFGSGGAGTEDASEDEEQGEEPQSAMEPKEIGPSAGVTKSSEWPFWKRLCARFKRCETKSSAVGGRTPS